jgi:hypothetical protein
MKKLITKAQVLGKRAAELRERVQDLPAQAAKIREAVTLTGAEFHQLRAEVQTGLHALKADTEDSLLRTMRQINEHALVFEEAGYELTGLDLDLAPHQRLAVHLDKFADVPLTDLRSLHARQTCAPVRSLLSGIMRAEESAARVELAYLQYAGLIFHAGALPMVRMRWRADAPDAGSTASSAATTFSPALPGSAAPAPEPASMFEERPMPPIRVQASPLPAPGSGSNVAPAVPTAPAPASAWSQSALDRFKKMPALSKYGRPAGS